MWLFLLFVLVLYFCFYFQKALRSEFPEAKDDFLMFIFQSQDDMETFLCHEMINKA